VLVPVKDKQYQYLSLGQQSNSSSIHHLALHFM
jgi:hypothetical protein